MESGFEVDFLDSVGQGKQEGLKQLLFEVYGAQGDWRHEYSYAVECDL